MLEERTETPCQGESWSFSFLTSAAKSARWAPAPSLSPSACATHGHRCQGFFHPCASSIPGQGLSLLPIQRVIGDVEPRRPLNWGEWIFLTGCQRLPCSFSTIPLSLSHHGGPSQEEGELFPTLSQQEDGARSGVSGLEDC